MATEKSAFEKQLEKLKNEYALQLPGKIAAIASDWAKLCEQWEQEIVILLHRNVHSLIGTSGTFGFTDLSKSARDLETVLKPLGNLPTDFKPDTELLQQVGKGLKKLQSLVDVITGVSSEEPEPIIEPKATETDKKPVENKTPILFYLDTAEPESTLLAHNMASYGFALQHFRKSAAFFSALVSTRPALVVVNMQSLDLSEADFYEKIHAATEKSIVTFIINAQDNVQSRLKSVRAGIAAHFTDAKDAPQLMERYAQFTGTHTKKTPHIFIVDDQKSVTQFYTTVLEQAGMEVTTENSALNALHLLSGKKPDLFLLDLNMPDIDGDELAIMIREQDEFRHTPMIFLSAELEPAQRTHQLTIDAFNLLSKDVSAEILLQHIHHHLRCAAPLLAMQTRDSLTGQLNHTSILRAAEHQFKRSQLAKITDVVCIIDIDHFKQMNETYDYETGDRVLRAVAQFVQRNLRDQDALGRFGEHQLMLVLADININNAGTLINKIRKSFSEIQFIAKEATFTVNFSAGLAENASAKTLSEQIHNARGALNRAKERGGNVVCVSLKDAPSKTAGG